MSVTTVNRQDKSSRNVLTVQTP